MRVIKDNEELKSLIVDGKIVIEESIICGFDINVEANIYAWNIDANNINARNIDAIDIKALDINARNISAIDIIARNIKALDINASNIKADDIKAISINAVETNASNINKSCKVTIKETMKEETREESYKKGNTPDYYTGKYKDIKAIDLMDYGNIAWKYNLCLG